MGQRLAINFTGNGEEICNCYYHWSAYTESALSLIADFWDGYKVRNEERVLDRVVGTLVDMGAGFADDEWQRVSEKHRLACAVKHNEPNRNDGLIGITAIEQEDNLRYAEGVADVDLDSGFVDFGVMYCYSDEEQYRNELRECGDDEEGIDKIIADIPDIQDVDPDYFPLDETRHILTLMTENPQGIRHGNRFYTWIC